MSARLEVQECSICGYVAFPPRVLCHRCGGASWRAVPGGEGVLDAATTVRRAVGAGEYAEPVRIGSVRLDRGPTVIARLDGDLAAGARVSVALDGAAIVARASAPG